MSIKLIGRLSSSVLLTVVVLFVLTIAVNNATPKPVQAAVDSIRSSSIRGALSTSAVTLPQVIKTLQFPLGVISGIQVMAANPKTGYIYAGAYEGLSIISDTQVIKNLDINASALGVNSVTGLGYAVDHNTLHILSGTEVITSLIVNGDSYQKSIGVNSRTGYVYIADAAYGDMTIVSGTQVISSFNIGGQPVAVGVNPATGYIYVPNLRDGVLILSGTDIITRLGVSGGVGIGINSKSGLIYLSGPTILAVNTNITVISGTEIITSIQASNWGAYDIGINEETGYAYAVDEFRKGVLVLSGTEVITTLAIPCNCISGGSYGYPRPIGVSPATGYLYIGTLFANKVTMISGTEVITSLTLPSPGAIQVESITGRAYVATPSELAVFSGIELSGNISPGFRPEYVRAAPPSQYAYLGSSSATGGVVSILGEQVLPPTTLDPLKTPVDFDADSAAGLVYVPDYYSQTISILYGTEVIGTIPVPHPPVMARFNRFTGYGYAILVTPSGYELVVLHQQRVIATISFPSVYVYALCPSGIALNPQTGYIYVTLESYYGIYPELRAPSYVFVITGSQVVASPTIGLQAKAPAVNPRTGYIYIPNQFSDNVSIFRGANVVATVPVTSPGAAAVNPATGYVYIADQYKTAITILSGTQVVTRLETGFPASTRYAPVSGYNPPQNATLEVNPASGYVYLLHDCCHALTVISGTSLLGTIEVGTRPRSVSANPDTGLVYVANDLDQNVTVIQDLIIPRSQTLSSLFTPDDDLLVCFSGAVQISTVNFQIEPALPFTVNWSTNADCATISHSSFQSNRPYTLSVKAGGQSPAGIVVVAKDFSFRYHPYHWFLPRLDRFVY